jgi:predicted aspartyl protease
MAKLGGRNIYVVGKFDTGASRTVLTFRTAEALGILKPKAGGSKVGQAQTADGHCITYHVHLVSVTIPNPNPAGQPIKFTLEAGFAEKLPANLFGMDWVNYLCVAIDRQRVHALRA